MESLAELKENYIEFQKKYDLPCFDDLNRDFKIEKLYDVETDFLVREVRIFISDALDHFLRFIEALLNPVNVPMFFFPIVKSLGSDEKEKLTEIHKKLSSVEIDLMKLIIYSEEKEAEFIKKGFKLWQEIKRDFVDLLEVVEKKLEVKSDKKNNGYFG